MSGKPGAPGATGPNRQATGSPEGQGAGSIPAGGTQSRKRDARRGARNHPTRTPTVSLAYGTGPPGWRSGRGGRDTQHIEITDGPSRGRIVDFHLSAAQFTDLMRGGNVRIQGAWLPSGEVAARIGRTQRTASTELHNTAVGDIDAAVQRVAADYLAAGWESVDTRRTNYGRLVVARRWDDAPAE